MNEKTGRNDPCPCGSGKKYKQCCMSKGAQSKLKIKAKWLNKPEGPNLMERVYGDAISSTGKTYVPPKDLQSSPEEKKE